MEFGQHVGKQILNWIKEYKREWESEHYEKQQTAYCRSYTTESEENLLPCTGNQLPSRAGHSAHPVDCAQ